jgi:hypothetical protein
VSSSCRQPSRCPNPLDGKRPLHSWQYGDKTSVYFSSIAGLPPDMREAGKCHLDMRRRQQQRHAIPVHDVRRMHFYCEHPPLRVYQDVPLVAFDSLCPIIPPLASHCGRLDALTVDDASPRLHVAAPRAPELFSARRVPLLPDSRLTPEAKGVIRCLPCWELMGQPAPLTTRPDDVEDCIEHLTQRVLPRSTRFCGTREKRGNPLPLIIRQIARITGAFHTPSLQVLACCGTLFRQFLTSVLRDVFGLAAP